MKSSKRKVFGFVVAAIIALGFLLPQHVVKPVAGADNKSYKHTFNTIRHGH
jgi:hypothetical protein